MAPFDPFQQSFTLLDGTGTSFNISLPDLDEFTLYNLQNCVNYGAQIGGSIVLLIVLLLLSNPEKHGTPIFIFNVLALAFNIIRNVLQALFFTGPFVETYAYFAHDYSHVHTGDYASSVADTVFNVLILICVEISLCLQTQVVCITLRELYRKAILAMSILIASVAVIVRMALSVENSKAIVKAVPEDSLQGLASASNITATISICWFCVVFVSKLGVAIRQRRELGLKQFGPMQVIFIMGCQTLIVPVIFAILQYPQTGAAPAMGSNVLTSVVIFLPLSSLWASATLQKGFRDSKFEQYNGKMLQSCASASTRPAVDRSNHDGTVSPSNVSSARISSNLPSPRGDIQRLTLSDIEAQGL